MPQFDVFLSHNSVDKHWVIKLKDDLQRYGVSVWLDKDEIRPGDLFAQALEEGLENSQTMALVVSSEGMASGWVKEEYYHALSLAQGKQSRLQLIPVMLRDAELPGFLAGRNWVDFREKSTYSQNVWELVWGITGTKPAEVLDMESPDVPLIVPDQPEAPTEKANNHQDEPQPSAESTTPSDTLQGKGQEEPVQQLPEDEPREPPPPPPLPISTSSEFIDTSWGESAPENDQWPPHLRVYLALPGRLQRLKTLISEREFTVDIQANRVFLEEERRGRVKRHEPGEFSEANTAEIIGDVRWIFTRYASSELVRFDDDALGDIAISFDPKTVGEAVLVKRERVGRQRRIRDDYYLLVFKKE
jgi:hypothetical protein